jgi:hypothetical protein
MSTGRNVVQKIYVAPIANVIFRREATLLSFNM